MPGHVIGTQFNNGYPGQVSRQGDEVSRTRPVNADSENIYFGDPVIITPDGSIIKADVTLTAVNFAGVAMRRVKSASIYPQQNNGFYAPADYCDILERGPITVQCLVGTPTINGDVYIRTVLNDEIPAGLIGGYEAAADDTKSIKLTNAKWGTLKDANGVAELVIQNRQGV